jgi:hypothetical protein
MLNKLGKLLKYEFLFYFRILPPLYAVLILVALIVRLRESLRAGDSPEAGISVYLLLFAWNAMVIAIGVITLVLIIQRYWENFMKDPGALMFTLPVTVWALTASKVIAAVGMVLAGGLSVAASAAILFKGTDNWLLDTIKEVWKSGETATKITAAPVGLIMIFQSICLIYLIITVIHMLPKLRFVAGCAIYLAVTGIVEQPIFRLIIRNFGNQNFLSGTSSLQIAVMGIVSLVFAAVYFWLTGYFLKSRFNLE